MGPSTCEGLQPESPALTAFVTSPKLLAKFYNGVCGTVIQGHRKSLEAQGSSLRTPPNNDSQN